MNEKMYFRVKIGYPNEFISITEDELKKALKAQIGGGVVVFAEGSIAGNSIISITPDWHKAGGFNYGYVLTNEDFMQIGKARMKKHQVFFLETQKSLNNPVKVLN